MYRKILPVVAGLLLCFGDLFVARVARVAGNFVNDDILGSLEFATKLAGAKLIVVMGHTE